MIELGLKGMRWQAHSKLNGAEYAEEAHNLYRRHWGLLPLERGERSTRLPTTDMTLFRTLFLHDDKLIGTFEDDQFVSSPNNQETARRVYFLNNGALQYIARHEIPNTYPTDLNALGHSAKLPVPLTVSEVSSSGVITSYGLEVIGGLAPPNPTVVDDADLYREASFVFTYVDRFNAESRASLPSKTIWYKPGETEVTLKMLSITQSPDTIGVRLYMTVNRQYFQLGSPLLTKQGDPTAFTEDVPDLNIIIDLSNPHSITDPVRFEATVLLDTATLTEPLITTYWAPPPTGLKHLEGLDNGMVVAADDHTLYFCEPYQLHAWPTAFERPIEGVIKAIAKTSAGFAVFTDLECHFFIGNTPEGMQETSKTFLHPITDPNSVCVTDDGVIYLCNQGLAFVNSNGGSIITDSWIDAKALLDHVDLTTAKCELYEGRILMATRNPENNNPIGYIFNLMEQDITSFDLTEDAMLLGFWRDPSDNDICYSDDLAGLAIFNRGDKLRGIYETGDIEIPRAVNLCVAHVDAEEYPQDDANSIKLTVTPEDMPADETPMLGRRPQRIKSTGRARQVKVRINTGKYVQRVMLTTDAKRI